jgi:hypothetical protein
MEQYCGPQAVEFIPGKHCYFSTYLAKRERDQSGAFTEVQFPDYGTALWSPGSRIYSRKAGKHCDFSTYFNKRARAQLAACAEMQLPDYGTVLWPLAVEMIPGKHCNYSKYLAKRARAQSGACAEVHFPDYGRVLWASVSRNDSRKALRFHHLFCQESEVSVWNIRRGAVS